MIRPQDEDTICALATAQGQAGIAVIRISGPRSWAVVREISPFLPQNPESHKVYYGSLKYQEKIIDETVILFFEEGRSFTSDYVAEIHCHGSPMVCSEILHILQNLGCRMAEKGEFTYRAFLSGRIDLVQAESILQVIQARSQGARRQALRFLKGHFSRQLKILKEKTQNLIAHIEADIDFSEENLSILSKKETLKIIQDMEKQILQFMENYKQGQSVSEGLRVGVFGAVNSGKSTLLNRFLGEDKAITSPHAGTTRDQVEGEIFLKGQRICFVDTAGIRKTKDLIENKGVKKTFQTLKEADVCLYLLDSADPDFESYKMLDLKILNYNDFVFVVNKIDLKSKKQFMSELKKSHLGIYKQMQIKKVFFISAQTGENLCEIKKYLAGRMIEGESALYSPRHFYHLKNALVCIQKACRLLEKDGENLELASFELKEVLKNIQNILGMDVDTDVLNNIFKQFCIGK